MGDKKRKPPRHHPLRELATRQHGVVSTRQLARIGYTRSSASKAHGVGRLTRVHRGVYAVGHTDLDWRGRCMAAVLANHPSLASHTAAARLWGLLKYEPAKIHVTVPTWRRHKPDFGLHFACLPRVDMRVEDEIPVTALARTKLDLAADFSTERLEVVLERSEELGVFDLGALHDVIDRNPRHPGSGPLAQALSIYAEDPAVLRSGLEKQFRAHVREARLPRPSMNYVIAGMELDAYWERERFAVELDVFETHGTNVAFERDRIRDDDLLALGIEMIRVTGPRLRREPEEIMRRLSDHLARRRRELG